MLQPDDRLLNLQDLHLLPGRMAHSTGDQLLVLCCHELAEDPDGQALGADRPWSGKDGDALTSFNSLRTYNNDMLRTYNNESAMSAPAFVDQSLPTSPAQKMTIRNT